MPAGKVPWPAGIGHQASARASRLIEPAPRLAGVASGSTARVGRGQRDEHPVLDVGGGGPVAVKPRADAVPRPATWPVSAPSIGTANSSKTTAVASGYPGKPITGATPDRWRRTRRPGLPGMAVADLGPLGVAEQRGMTGPDGDAGHRDAADLGEHRGGVVAAPPARPGDDQHQVRLGRRAPKLRGQRVRVVGHHGADQRAPRRAGGTARRA